MFCEQTRTQALNKRSDVRSRGFPLIGTQEISPNRKNTFGTSCRGIVTVQYCQRSIGREQLDVALNIKLGSVGLGEARRDTRLAVDGYGQRDPSVIVHPQREAAIAICICHCYRCSGRLGGSRWVWGWPTHHESPRATDPFGRALFAPVNYDGCRCDVGRSSVEPNEILYELSRNGNVRPQLICR